MSSALSRKLGEARERLEAGDATGALSLCQEILQRAPRNPDALTLFAICELMTGRPREAIASLAAVLAAQPRHGAALENLGLAHLMLGEFDHASRALATAATIPGAPASVHMRLGLALLNQGRHADAVQALQRALDLDPDNPDIHLNLGLAADHMGEPARARGHFETVLRLAPDHVDAMFNLGVVCLGQNELDAARLWFERVLAQAPRHADAVVNLGIVLEKQQLLEPAIVAFRRALEIDPSAALAREGLASACMTTGRFKEAVGHLHELARADSQRPGLLAALAEALFETGELDDAKSAAGRAIEFEPKKSGPYATLADIHAVRGEFDQMVATLQSGVDHTDAIHLLGKLTFQLRRLCDWERWRANWEQLSVALHEARESVSPFSLLCEPLSAEEQLAYARKWSAQFDDAGVIRVQTPALRLDRTRIRVGYFSSDYYENAVAYLVAEVLELHDRTRFEIFAYSYGPDDRSPMRSRMSASCEHFIDVARDPDDFVIARIRADELDILVDLKGYTLGARTSVLARRPCAIQVNWLGYPGTMGAKFIDYLIADSYLVPPGSEAGYAEQILRMPHCYQPNDTQRAIAAPLTRTEYGLPEHGFVFCGFNQSFKITPEIFACWMNLLRHTPDSVLWLLADNRWATENLTRAAQNHGINPERLFFAPKVPLEKHLARYAVADLALDSFPYGSHTTASDALWGNCLLVGLCGETFASRVSSSILNACNLPELITNTLEDYERLALRIATDDSFRTALRAKLAANKVSAPLFDSRAFTRDLENLYAGLVTSMQPPMNADTRR
jgi:protein O-GlcNAc transferase